MAIVKQRRLQDLLAKGVEEARRTSRHVLVSQWMRVEAVDPLAFFSSAKADRFFWRDPGHKVVMAGSETVCKLTAEGEGRFGNIEEQRKTLLQTAVLEGDSSILAVGPVFFGGFAFDPLKTKDRMWASFPDAELALPRLMLTAADGETWLTFNCLVGRETDPQQQSQQLVDEKNRLLAEARDPDFLLKAEPAYTVKEVGVESWMEAVEKAERDVRRGRGSLEKVVLSRSLQLTADRAFPPSQVLQKLSEEQPNSFLFAVERGDDCFLGASPERLASQQGNQLTSAAIAGSMARGQTVAEDEALGRKLLHDEKNRHEHEVVVAMIRQAMEEVCQSINIPDHPTLYKMKDIQHLYTPVVGTTAADSSLLAVLARLHPTPALGGFPQIAALEDIRKVESHDRGWYGAPVGWMDGRGNGEFAVAIRSGLLRGREAVLLAGNGIVDGSDPASEYRETQMKFQPMLSALGGVR